MTDKDLSGNITSPVQKEGNKITYLAPYRDACQVCQQKHTLIFILRIPGFHGIQTHLKLCQVCCKGLLLVAQEITGLRGMENKIVRVHALVSGNFQNADSGKLYWTSEVLSLSKAGHTIIDASNNEFMNAERIQELHEINVRYGGK